MVKKIEKTNEGSRSSRDCSERKHGCETCQRRFFTRKDVKRHQVVHTGSRQFVCYHCSHAFGRKDHLVRHEKKVHSQLKKGVLTPLIINDQLSFGLILPASQELSSTLNSSQLVDTESSPTLRLNHVQDTTDTDSTSPIQEHIKEEHLALTVSSTEAWDKVDTKFLDISVPEDDTSLLQTFSAVPSPTESISYYDSGVSSCGTPSKSTTDTSVFEDPTDLLEALDFVQNLNFFDVGMDKLEELCSFNTEDYFDYLE